MKRSYPRSHHYLFTPPLPRWEKFLWAVNGLLYLVLLFTS